MNLGGIPAPGTDVCIADLAAGLEEDTVENLRNAGLFKGGDLILTKRDARDTKAVRRMEVENGTGRCRDHGPREIVALFGDSQRDFFELYEGDNTAQALMQMDADPRWGTRFFVLPNPMYGQWERNYR